MHPGCQHIPSDANGNKDFTAVIKSARETTGFNSTNMRSAVGPELTVGFGHHTILGVADKAKKKNKKKKKKKKKKEKKIEGRGKQGHVEYNAQ